ncbi:ComEC/Rec2 family competence protein [Nocardioides sp.]|uniref:ComEC/Rec2 family competence protein n=1 Tax=Nocardioides sp. TaxID=35761 RepID=UPI0039E4DF9F
MWRDDRREQDSRADLRLPILGVAAWLGGGVAALAEHHTGVVVGAAVLLAAVLAPALRRASTSSRLTAVAAAVVMAGVAAVGLLRAEQIGGGPVADLADRRALVAVTGTVTADPRLISGGFADTVMVRLTARSVSSGGTRFRLRTPVLVLGDRSWAEVPLGATVRLTARLSPARSAGEAAALRPRDGPIVVRRPDLWWRGAAAVRDAIRDAVAHRPAEPRALVPALVDGDDSRLPVPLAEDFRTTGLTHLLAVSGTNLTLVVGFLLIVARWCGVRGRWLYLVGAAGIVGFILLARTEPSVVRAAAMGAVGLVAMSSNGRGRALRGLGAAVVLLLLLDPSLAVSLGFALSVSATAGILMLGPPWRDALASWLPRWLAEAVAVPLAAQLACTPLIAAISGQVSLAAVVANLLAEPAVGPATVLGLVAGLLGLVWDPLGRVPGTLASWCGAWIIAVAHRGAALPTAEIAWGTGKLALIALTVLVLAIALLGPRLLRHPLLGIGCALLMVAVVVIRLPSRGWPPDGWAMVMCDVGQGDGLVVSTGPGAALVVDTGPDPGPMGACLDRLGVSTVPLLVLTHFDADHVGGVAAVFSGRRVGEVWTTSIRQPSYGVGLVDDAATAAGLAAEVAPYGRTISIGEVRAQVLWPRPDLPDGLESNAGSVVLLIETRGLRLLLTGDIEPDVAARIAATVPGLRVDVLKVPHHGSRFQDEDWLLSLHPSIALTSVGAGNTYGHPAATTLDPLAAAGARVYRTDRDGSLAVVPGPDGVRAVSQ